MALLPGLELRFDRMKADLLLRLLTHRNTIAASMIALRRELPDADIAAMVARYPALVMDFSESELVGSIAAVRCALPLPVALSTHRTTYSSAQCPTRPAPLPASLHAHPHPCATPQPQPASAASLRLLASQMSWPSGLSAARCSRPAPDHALQALVGVIFVNTPPHQQGLCVIFSASRSRVASPCVRCPAPTAAARCREALPGAQGVGGMLELEPRILTVDIQSLLTEIERLLPGQDPQKLLIQNPSVRPASRLCCPYLLFWSIFL